MEMITDEKMLDTGFGHMGETDMNGTKLTSLQGLPNVGGRLSRASIRADCHTRWEATALGWMVTTPNPSMRLLPFP